MLASQRRTILVAVGALVLWPAAARAQLGTTTPSTAPADPSGVFVPFTPPGPPYWLAKYPANSVIPGSPYAPPPAGYTPPPTVPVPPPYNPRLYSVGMGCWSHHTRACCSSLQSTLKFIFGPCRTFYGEPCLQGPPKVPAPNGLGFRGNGPP